MANQNFVRAVDAHMLGAFDSFELHPSFINMWAVPLCATTLPSALHLAAPQN
jgi:hypothetical protein